MLNKVLLKHTFTLSFGTAIASLIPIVLQPFLRSVFTPAEFGLYAVYISLVGILVVISTLKYETVVLLPENDQDSLDVVGVALLTSFLFNILILILLFFIKDYIIKLLGFPPKYRIWLYCIPVSAMLFSSFNALNYWMIRVRAYKYSAYCKILRRGFEGSGQLLLGKFMFQKGGLIIGDLMGQFVNLVSGLSLARRSGFSIKQIRRSGMRRMADKYKTYSIYNTIPTLFNTITLAMPVFLVNKFYSETSTGQLDLARLILFIPLVLISEPLSQVLYKNFRESFVKKKRVMIDLIQIGKILLIFSLIGIVSILLWADELTNLFFGLEWQESASDIKILVYSVALRFIVDPFKFVFVAFEKIKILSLWQVFYFVTVSILGFFPDLEIQQFLGAFVILESFCYFILFFLVIKIARNYEKIHVNI